MSVEEVGAEAAYLLQQGYSDIELVAATDPDLLNSERASRFIEATKDAGAVNVGINFFPLCHTEDYQRLSEVGCTFAIVWQETYLSGIYRTMHPRGPKANMRYRIDAHDRALRGGIKTVGVAFLGGLADWRFEALATISHAQYLQNEYGANIIFGMPRWKYGKSTPMHVAPSFYGDKDYELVGILYSLAIPDSLVWFSTREHFDLSVQCARGGGCLFTLDCSTEVSGYTKPEGTEQFPVYTRPFTDGVSWLQGMDFDTRINLPW
jgi:2-iminoacetate synthase